MTLKTRRPTGMPPWPILLLAGVEKSGKSYAAAAASGSEMIGRTLWVGIGDDDPDEYGAIDHARFEIVEHDGTYRGILNAARDAQQALAGDKEPGLLVLDSATRLWNLLSDEAQATANARAAKKGNASDADRPISMDLWNTAKQRWQHVLDCLRDHDGPSIVTARLDLTAVVNEKGDPTKEKVWKVQAEKSLPYDVGATVELPSPGEALLTGVRSLRVKGAQTQRRPFPGFTVEKLWQEMGLADGTSPRQHSTATGAESVRADEALAAKRNALLTEIAEAADRAGVSRETIAANWREANGHAIAQTTDLGSLELLRDDLNAQETAA